MRRQIELAITVLDREMHDEIQEIPIWRDQMYCVCSPEHPLAATQNIDFKMLCEHHAILPESKTVTYRTVKDVFISKQLTLNTHLPTNFLETIKMMVSVGLGWSLLPKSMIDKNLSVLQWPEELPTRTLGVIHLKNRTLSNATNAFIDMLKKQTDFATASV